jgi:hypothetical protein
LKRDAEVDVAERALRANETRERLGGRGGIARAKREHAAVSGRLDLRPPEPVVE